MKRRSKWLSLVTLLIPSSMLLQCTGLLLAELQSVGIGVFSTVVEAIAFDLVDQILGIDTTDGTDSTQ